MERKSIETSQTLKAISINQEQHNSSWELIVCCRNITEINSVSTRKPTVIAADNFENNDDYDDPEDDPDVSDVDWF